MCYSWAMVNGFSPAAALRWKLLKERSMISSTEVQAVTLSIVSTTGHKHAYTRMCTSGCYPQLKYIDRIFLQKSNICVRSRHCSLASVSYPSLSLTFSPTTYNIQYTEVTLFSYDFGNMWPYWLLHLCQAFKSNFVSFFVFSVFCFFSMLPNHVISTP